MEFEQFIPGEVLGGMRTVGQTPPSLLIQIPHQPEGPLFSFNL